MIYIFFCFSFTQCVYLYFQIGIFFLVLVIQCFRLTWKAPVELLTLDVKRQGNQGNAECSFTTVNHTKQNAVPKIVHYIWFYNKSTIFRFHHLISILSASKVIKPDEIIVWNLNPPTGPYWKEATQKIQNLTLKHKNIPFEIYGNRITVKYFSKFSFKEFLKFHYHN